LVAALILCAMSFNLYVIAQTTFGVSRQGEPAFLAERTRVVEENRAFQASNSSAQDSTSFANVVVARLQHMRWFYAQPFSFLPVNTVTLFLIGVIGLRLGIFDAPTRHRRLIVALMIFGAASWAFETWLPEHQFPPGTPILRQLTLTRVYYGMGLIRGMWLAFTYMGAVLLLVARNPVWLRRLPAFGWTGRMALTNYMVQIVILDLLFSKYAFDVTLTPLGGLAAAIILFVVDVLFSRWWLSRHPYGPLEWLWRSATYARWQPWSIETRELARR